MKSNQERSEFPIETLNRFRLFELLLKTIEADNAVQVTQAWHDDRILTLKELCQWFGIGRTTYYRWRNEHPELLPPALPGYKQPKWRVGDVRAFLRAKTLQHDWEQDKETKKEQNKEPNNEQQE